MDVKLITRKSECRNHPRKQYIKSPKEAIRRTLSNYQIRDGIIVNVYQPSYVSKDAIVLRNQNNKNNRTIQLSSSTSILNAAI